MKEHRQNETEMPLQEVLSRMKNNTYANFQNFSLSSINKDYLKLRPVIFKILQKITMKMGFKSQTFFLSIYYLDILFMKKKKININIYKLALAALCLSAKYCENDPIVPQFQYFIKIYNNVMGYKNIISMSDLLFTEVVVCKLLDYKLNYFSIYDFNTFFFCHGILKLEQIKDIENEFKKNYCPKNKEFTINKLFIKNILGKIYKITRNYLDIVVNKYNIIFRYNPIFITIYVLRKCVEEILGDEFKKNCIISNNEQKEKEKQKFIKKNSNYFRDIMKDFYKIDYESNEQYQELMIDDEMKKIFKEKDRKPKKKDENENEKNNNNNNGDKNNVNNINNNTNDISNDENNKIFNSSAANGFYKRLKIPINDDINNTKNIKNTINPINVINTNINTNTTTNIDDINSNFNINEFKKSQLIINKDKKNYFLNKIPISRINTYNSIDTHILTTLNSHNKTDIKDYTNENTEIKTGSNSPNINTSSDYKKIKKRPKINTMNEKSNNYIFINDGNEDSILNNTNDTKKYKKPYLKKLICLNNNKDIFNSIMNSIKSSTVTNFYNSKNTLPSANKQSESTFISHSKNLLTVDNYNINKNKSNFDRNDNNNDNNIFSYLSSFQRRTKFMNQQNKKKFINTSIGERYKRKIKSNLYCNNNIKERARDISPLIKNDKSILNDNNININTERYDDVKSSTCDNFYPRKLPKISVNLNNREKNLQKIENINKELHTGGLPLLISNKHNVEFKNSSKEVNKKFKKNAIDEHKLNGFVTTRNNNEKDKLYVNIMNDKNKAKQFKKINYNKIQKKYLIDNNNTKNKKSTFNNKNASLNLNRNNNKKSAVEKNKNISINVHNITNKPVTKKISFKNNNDINKSSNNITEGPLTSRIGQQMIRDQIQDNFHSSLYKIIKNTKNLFTKNKKEKEETNANSNYNNNLENKAKKINGNNNFYKSQQNFYKNKSNNRDNNTKNTNTNTNDIKIKENSYAKNAINKTKAIKDKANYNDKKNNSTIIINNNININIGNNDKNVKMSQFHLNNVIVNSHSNYNINNNNNLTQRNMNNKKSNNINMNNSNNNSKRNINYLNQKLPFNKKIINKNKK